MKCRIPTVALWTAGIAIGFAASSMADMYYYRDGKGQLHLTNVLSTVPSAYRSKVIKAQEPQGRSVAPTSEEEMPAAQKQPQPPQSTAVAPEEAPQRARPDASTATASVVSTRQFGLLQLRMSDYTVLHRLGPPAAITEVAQPASGAPSSGQVIRVVRGEIWYYPGNRTVPPTQLEFSNNVLVHKERLERY